MKQRLRFAALRTESGSSLIETVVVSLVSLITILACIELGLLLRTTVLRAQSRVDSARLADQIMEELLVTTAMAPELQPGVHNRIYDRTGTEVTANGTFTSEWEITELTSLSNTVRIDVKVSVQQMGIERSVRLITFRSL